MRRTEVQFALLAALISNRGWIVKHRTVVLHPVSKSPAQADIGVPEWWSDQMHSAMSANCSTIDLSCVLKPHCL